MSDRIASAQREATKARERALTTGDERVKAGWLTIASVWDKIAREHRELDELHEKLEKLG